MGNKILLADSNIFFFSYNILKTSLVTNQKFEVFGCSQQVFKVMGVNENHALAAKRAICFISAVNWQ